MSEVNNLVIRKLNIEEIPTALSLVWNVFLQFEAPDYTEEGVAEFRSSVWNDNYLKMLTFYGAFQNESLVGVLATRSEGNHIALFFVDSEYQNKGIGKALFKSACKNNTTGKITVNSSPFAVPIYRSFGFNDTNTQQEKNGIRFTPMEYIIKNEKCSCSWKNCKRYGDCLACREHHETIKRTLTYCDLQKQKKLNKKKEESENENCHN